MKRFLAYLLTAMLLIAQGIASAHHHDDAASHHHDCGICHFAHMDSAPAPVSAETPALFADNDFVAASAILREAFPTQQGYFSTAPPSRV